ncbi:hypothetical protein PENANT_c001G04635 [Penicillium antarcticum]|uniref:Uncharacterized protein n=1 Tax=Penicillium antarcticum TaxID=416450 RepID=A0A1V6QPS2_9EURO|nr:uncharacterized protein N7508_010832 [Penicillium antarcticum]KAJ5296011.1 hypothetical protein N7508_010832 [Penicillium antarcticum]OQD90946.1 hypothetical protein PENANT_c001G04635 [Penicillium antarcticum]
MKVPGLAVFVLSYLSTAALANPHHVDSVTIQLANDQSGANANVDIPTDGQKRSVESLWGHTSVAKDGVVYASSAQLVAFQQDTVCVIFGDGDHAQLNARQTWVSLKDGKVVKLDHAYVVCEDV